MLKMFSEMGTWSLIVFCCQGTVRLLSVFHDPRSGCKKGLKSKDTVRVIQL